MSDNDIMMSDESIRQTTITYIQIINFMNNLF